MFCPQCQIEYREGFSICTDCNIKLEADIPSKLNDTIEKSQPIKFIEVRSGLRQDEISIIRSVFDANEINYQIEGEHFGTFIRASNFMRLLVDTQDYEKATELLNNLI
jgi:hypothetical protein